ncbi:MAG TPA: DNA mismatch repair endonuclease MutL, partial [bacterium]|nr:DNA mismatch repair endonuclease MutL [bacterium]
MSKIHLLSPETIGRIAAGEVIERPASAIKELIENSIDAGATKISVEISKAGKMFIKVKDNGSGIAKEDMDAIFLRHATSKINQFEDLSYIHSFGFRGEALYSIASVSEIFLRSRTGLSETGWEIYIKNGEKGKPKPVALQQGTEIEVHNLFFNVPARRKFLRADATEFHKILAIFIPYAIAFPEKTFALIHNKKDIFNLKGGASFKDRIKNIFNFNPEFLHEIIHKSPDGSLSLHLILGDINIQRTRRDAQFLFVNNRPVQCSGISFVVNDVYRCLMPAESHPFFAVFIEVPSQDIDVNIHPTKREVKIRNEYAIADIIKKLCEDILNKETAPKQIYLPKNFQSSTQKISDVC